MARYLEVAVAGTKMKSAKTPFLVHDSNERIPESHKGAPRSIEVEEPTEKNNQVGAIAASAASVLMKCLYAARMARFDLLRPVQGLAKYLTKWTKRQDDANVLYQHYEVVQACWVDWR